MDASRRRRYLKGAGLVTAGLLAGGILAGTISATAAPHDTGARGELRELFDGARGKHYNEDPLTGETADKVRAAVLAKYPNATVDRLETDSDGVYEAHLTTAEGNRLTAELDSNFVITGVEQGRGRGRQH